jgi:hypothetical protein
MKLDNCRRLTLSPVSGVWFRTVELQYLEASLATAHNREKPSRFCGGMDALTPFEILYLSETQLVAHFEVGSLLGDPWDPARVVSAPGRAWADINVAVRLQFVADLTQPGEQRLLRTTAQELTGDWRGHYLRQIDSPIPEPVGRAPTQELGEALYNLAGVEGFLSVSEKLPTHRNLNVFPAKLQAGSRIIFKYAPRGIRLEIRPKRQRRRPTRRRQPRE